MQTKVHSVCYVKRKKRKRHGEIENLVAVKRNGLKNATLNSLRPSNSLKPHNSMSKYHKPTKCANYYSR